MRFVIMWMLCKMLSGHVNAFVEVGKCQVLFFKCDTKFRLKRGHASLNWNMHKLLRGNCPGEWFGRLGTWSRSPQSADFLQTQKMTVEKHVSKIVWVSIPTVLRMFWKVLWLQLNLTKIEWNLPPEGEKDPLWLRAFKEQIFMQVQDLHFMSAPDSFIWGVFYQG